MSLSACRGFIDNARLSRMERGQSSVRDEARRSGEAVERRSTFRYRFREREGRQLEGHRSTDPAYLAGRKCDDAAAAELGR